MGAFMGYVIVDVAIKDPIKLSSLPGLFILMFIAFLFSTAPSKVCSASPQVMCYRWRECPRRPPAPEYVLGTRRRAVFFLTSQSISASPFLSFLVCLCLCLSVSICLHSILLRKRTANWHSNPKSCKFDSRVVQQTFPNWPICWEWAPDFEQGWGRSGGKEKEMGTALTKEEKQNWLLL